MNPIFLLAVFSLTPPSLAAADTPPARVVVRGQGTALGETPVVVRLPGPITPGVYALKAEGGQTAVASVYRDGDATYLAAVLSTVPASGEVVYAVNPAGPDARAAGITLKDAGNVAITIGGKPFTTYTTSIPPKPYYFPVYGPTGQPFTRSFPMQNIPGEKRDHPHQRSFWFTHGKVNGVDFWSEQTGHGTIRETSRTLVDGGPTVAIIRTTDDWIGPDGRVICNDTRAATFYATRSARIIDFAITIKAGNAPVTFGDTKEGMFGVRVATSMDVDSKRGGRITNAEGLTDAEAWGKASPWVDYTGPVHGQTVGIAILNSPTSFRYPTTWHVRTYGLFAANPFGWHDFGRKDAGDYTVPAGDSIRFAYRVILHEGATDAAGLPAAFSGYEHPPTIEVQTH